VIATAAIITAVLSSIAYQEAAAAHDRRRFPAPGRLVDIGGRRLHLLEAGEGMPAVVVVPALGDNILTWVRIQRELAGEMRVILYDRAGLGWSDPPPLGGRTFDDMAAELRSLLACAGVEPPFVLVAHSLGGIVARRFAARYPAEVAGLVFVDSSHEGQVARRSAVGWRYSPAGQRWRALKRRAQPLSLYRLADAAGAAHELEDDVAREVLPEHSDAHRAILLSSRQRRAVVREQLLAATLSGTPPRLGSIPVTVITAGRDDPDWAQMQNELAALSSDSRHLFADGSGHYVQRDDPALVLKAIRDIVGRMKPAGIS
jgi:pimeloyl-ACP methyl ester carboxylesterase